MTRPTSPTHPAPSFTVTRRGALGLAGVGLAGGLATPALAQPTIEWKMATAWPADLPGPGQAAQRICDAIALLSGGRMRVRLFPAGGLVPGSEVFDAVSAGTAQMGHASATFWQDRLPAAVFFATVPFGFLPHEHVTWIEQGGGQALWDRLYAPFAVKPFPGGNGGGQLGGWFMKPVQTLDDLKGLRVRMPGLGGEVMRRLGATPVSLPPAELVPALKSGLIDAAEFLGPESDRAMGFQTVSKLCYTPGFHEPNGTTEALVNRVAYEGLPDDLRAIIAAACRMETLHGMSESAWKNAEAMRQLVAEDGVELKVYPTEITSALRDTSNDVVAGLAAGGDLDREIYKSYVRALARLALWSDASERLFLERRRLS
ncbi:TRAP transporter substrate-binding protein [Stappia sp. MMSF_3263]|uniref:TRAP transporter substrate-binding protein n=1 Tax=Stappia sp. MMSF_3263 TaxID=3046693 RepID=UPI0027401934|nr:TRAP transporter substrate-binding protein [Stappia sp. MMSF_3263]